MWYSRCDMPLLAGGRGVQQGTEGTGREDSRARELERGSRSPRASSWRRRSTPRRKSRYELLASLPWLGQGAGGGGVLGAGCWVLGLALAMCGSDEKPCAARTVGTTQPGVARAPVSHVHAIGARSVALGRRRWRSGCAPAAVRVGGRGREQGCVEGGGVRRRPGGARQGQAWARARAWSAARRAGRGRRGAVGVGMGLEVVRTAMGRARRARA